MSENHSDVQALQGIIVLQYEELRRLKIEIEILKKYICHSCNGTGREIGLLNKERDCYTCKGTGRRSQS